MYRHRERILSPVETAAAPGAPHALRSRLNERATSVRIGSAAKDKKCKVQGSRETYKKPRRDEVRMERYSSRWQDPACTPPSRTAACPDLPFAVAAAQDSREHRHFAGSRRPRFGLQACLQQIQQPRGRTRR